MTKITKTERVRKGTKRGPNTKAITIDSVNPVIKNIEFAIRGPLNVRALEIEKELEKGVEKPFTEVIKANVGDAHAMGQLPITFIRQVLALVTLPELLDDPKYPADVKSRARTILANCRGGSIGSYTEAMGLDLIRKHVAEYIQERDRVPADLENIVLSCGATDGVRTVLKLLGADVNNKQAGVMIPIPQYPLYSSTLTDFDMTLIGYYLDEENNWSLNISELERAIEEAEEHCHPRAIVVINPGNPTGQVLTRKNIEEIIKFAYRENLFILADEVYQYNIYADGSEFHSFKKVLMEMGEPYCRMELASFYSVSKGYMGECGIRGGYAEVINLDPQVRELFEKLINISLCPATLGQVAMECTMNPPREGEPSYELFMHERNSILNSLKERAKLVAETFDSVEGLSCQPVQGAMYAFPKLELPPKALAKAASLNLDPSVFYALRLLESTGVCVVPGAGFGQKPGTHHVRTTILPQVDQLESMLTKFKEFHMKFLAEYK